MNAHPVTISVLPETEATEEAQALGWSDGIPGVTVTVSLPDSASTLADSGTTSANGQVTLGPLVPGSYIISLLRVLDDQERARLPSGSSLEGFALTADISVTASETLSATALRATRGSLVTSEWFNSPGYYGEFPYETGVFWEIYNNSDSAIRLDGLILGLGRSQSIETQQVSCSEGDIGFLEPDGVWSTRLDRIEGTGSADVVQPGQIVVVAGYAIDHSVLFQNALDLRNSDFEFGSGSGTDNPEVPNLTWLGPNRQPAGQIFNGTAGVPMILLPLDADALDSKTELGITRYLKVPAAAILDVFAWRHHQTVFATCRHMVDPAINLDVAEGGIGPDPFLISRNRRVLYTKPDGRKVLLRTKSSRTDFVDGPRTPGVIP